MKIYTKGGDAGETSLASGKRVWKNDMRVSLYGQTDELNSQLGLAASLLPATLGSLKQELQGIQSLLFELASELADWQGVSAEGSLGTKDIAELEDAIDRMESELPKLKAFILPGGHAAASALHVARTVCRSLERNLVAAVRNAGQETHKANLPPKTRQRENTRPTGESHSHFFRPEILKYINRLSDYLFVMARYVNSKTGHPDTEWKSRNQ